MSVTDLRQRLAAILAADAAGYSRLMAADERATVGALDAARDVFRAHVEANHGRVVDTAGDSVLAVFETASGASLAAIAIQQDLEAASSVAPEERRMRFRIGVHLGDVIEKPDGTVYGDGINIAARLQALAEPGGIAVSDAVRGAVRGKVSAAFEDRGEQQVKNLAQPVRAFRLVNASPSAAEQRTVVDVSAPVPGFGGRPAIAVLPFENMSGDPEQEYFADGLAEDVLTRLAMWRWVPVIARNSSFTYKGRATDAKEIGRALGARYLLEGSVRRSTNRVRVTAQLIDAETGRHLWAERYDRVLQDLFAIQDDLTDGIVGALEAAVGRAETDRARLKPPGNLDAWETFQRGWWHMVRATREDLEAAMPLFYRAAALDPGSSQPHAAIALARLLEAFFLWTRDPGEAFGDSARHARAALAADAMDALPHAVLGYALALSRKHDDALLSARRAIELNPSFAMGHNSCGVVYMYRGELEAAIRACETAIRISPHDPSLHIWLTTLSACHYLARDYDRAAEVARLAVQRGPNHPIAWRSYANALGQLGRLDEAREALARFLALMPAYTTEAAARETVGLRDEAMFQHYLEGLRKAGWPG